MPWTEIIIISVVLAIMGAVWVIMDLSLYASQEAEVKTNQTHAENTLKALKKLLEPLEENEPESWVKEFPSLTEHVRNNLVDLVRSIESYCATAEKYILAIRSKDKQSAREYYKALCAPVYTNTILEFTQKGTIRVGVKVINVKEGETVKVFFERFRFIREEMRTAREALSQVMKNLVELNAPWGISYGSHIASEVFGEYNDLVESGDLIAIEMQLEVFRSYVRVLGRYAVCVRNRKFRNPGMLDTMIQRNTPVADEDAWIKEALLFEAGYTKPEVS